MKHPMRKSNRAVYEKAELTKMIEQCDVCRMALYDGEFPYIVPLNFGFEVKELFVLYFHCATVGRKLDMMRKNNKVGFEMDSSHGLKMDETACECSMNYQSIIGEGEIFIVENQDERIRGLNMIMKKYGRTEDLHYHSEILSRTVVLKLVVSEICGKVLNH